MKVTKEKPILLLPKLAEKMGLNGAIFIQQLYYWLQCSKHVHNGHRWVYNSYEGWNEQFPFWSLTTIRRIVKKLENENVIITGNFNRKGSDNTKWYRINFEALSAVCGEELPLAEPDHDEQTEDPICPVSESNLDRALPENTTEKKSIVVHTRAKEQEPFTFFEQNGFGMIGGYLAEKIQGWCEDLSDELVIEAMKYAVESGNKNWKYVEAILRNWADKGYQHLDEVLADRRAFQARMKNKMRSAPQPTGRDIPRGFSLDLTAGEEPEDD